MVNKLTTNKLILFGDSQFEQSSNQNLGFNLAPALQHEYWSKLQIITHGYGGYTSEHARHIIDPILETEMSGRGNAVLIAIFFGTNDAAGPESKLQHVPLNRYQENLRELVKCAKRRSLRVVLIGPAPVNESAPSSPLDRSNSRAKMYAEAAEQVALAENVPSINLWEAFSHAAGSNSTHLGSLLADDGVHFTGSGYRVFFEIFLACLRDNWMDLRTENMTTIFPHIVLIDNDNLPDCLWISSSVSRNI